MYIILQNFQDEKYLRWNCIHTDLTLGADSIRNTPNPPGQGKLHTILNAYETAAIL